jgi:hypothetical protein
MRVPRKAAVLTAAVAAACVAVSACGSVQLGAAAITGGTRITSATLTNEVANLNAAYKQDKAKKVSPQLPVGQETQEVLTWLIAFQIYDRVAEQHGIHVTPAQVYAQLYGPHGLSAAAAENKVTLPEFVSAGGALPPNLAPELARLYAIEAALVYRITGGKSPSSTAGQSKETVAVNHAVCLASKSLDIRVNPQFGEYDYSSHSVVTAPPTLAANPSPSKPAAVKLTPPC